MRCTISDIDKVRRVLTDDSVHIPVYGYRYDNLCRDIALDSVSDDRIYTLMPNNSCVFIFCPYNHQVYMGHSFVMEKGRGKQAVVGGKSSIKWMFENTNCIKIFGLTPEYARNIIIYNRLLGFKQEGLLSNSITKDDRLYDQIIFGLSKGV